MSVPLSPESKWGLKTLTLGPALQGIVGVHVTTGLVPTGSQALPTMSLKTLPTTLSREVTCTWQAERGPETQGDGMTDSRSNAHGRQVMWADLLESQGSPAGVAFPAGGRCLPWSS